MRLFIAIPFSPEVRAHLTDAQARLRDLGVTGNVSRPENLHLTLAFLGETPRQRDAQRALSAIHCPAFPITVGGFGRFGDVLWMGVSPCPQLNALARDLQERLRGLGFSIERRPFRPHITLVRQAALPHGPLPKLPSVTMTADRAVLFSSSRQNGRLVYTPLFTRPLHT